MELRGKEQVAKHADAGVIPAVEDEGEECGAEGRDVERGELDVVEEELDGDGDPRGESVARSEGSVWGLLGEGVVVVE